MSVEIKTTKTYEVKPYANAADRFELTEAEACKLFDELREALGATAVVLPPSDGQLAVYLPRSVVRDVAEERKIDGMHPALGFYNMTIPQACREALKVAGLS